MYTGVQNRPRGARTEITVAAVAVNRASGLATGSAYSSAESLQTVRVAVTAFTTAAPTGVRVD
jgi:isopentenyl diphosphate isomerase/L-lactate dehydrogenase-like FMN-dependent dehydrogenase